MNFKMYQRGHNIQKKQKRLEKFFTHRRSTRLQAKLNYEEQLWRGLLLRCCFLKLSSNTNSGETHKRNMKRFEASARMWVGMQAVARVVTMNLAVVLLLS